jgi:iron complex outermembrane recepter protein
VHRRLVPIISRLLVTGLLAVAQSLSAQAPATAAISGRVQNVATGNYLGNARIAVKGTEVVVFSDQDGVYRIPRAPSGPMVLEVSYTGLDAEQISLNPTAGQTLERDVGLTNRGRYGSAEAAVKLDPFVVVTSKLNEGEALATNEQRHAANIKNVVSADAFGDISGGNIAEFLKYLPGLALDLESGEAISVSVRGIGSNMTAVSVDGAQAANSVSQGQSRNFQFKQISMNNASRIELYKVPTPANPADSLGGSVNIVSKSAFERSKSQFNYRLYLAANSDALTLRKTPFPDDKMVHNVLPAFDFDYTLPVNKNLGFVITGLASLQFVPQNITRMTYDNTNVGTGGSIARPFLSGFTLDEAPRHTQRDAFSIRADWRVRPGSVLTLSAQTSYYHDNTRDLQWAFSTGANGAPTVAGGVPLSYGEGFTNGATGRGAVTMRQSINNIQGVSNGGSARYRYDDGLWLVTAGLTHTFSKTWRRYLEFGNFNSVTSTISFVPIRVSLLELGAARPGTLQVFDNNNQRVDYRDLRNYKTTGSDGPTRGDNRETMDLGDFSIRRLLPALPVPVSVQVGGSEKIQTRDVRRQSLTWTYTSPDADQSATRFLSPNFSSFDNYFGFGKIPWTSPWRAYDLWQQSPSMFTKTLAQQVTEEKFRIQNSEHFQEIVDSLYAQVDLRLFRERLRILTGARYERTTDKGVGPSVVPGDAFLRDASGQFLHSATGARIRNPAAGAAGSLEETAVTYKERHNKVNRVYDGIYPSTHFTFNITEPFLIRLAYAKTYGRPDFPNIVPNATITENDISVNPTNPGTINIRNTALKPWTADNYDLSLEYYTRDGGVFTAGVFRKDIKDFFGSTTKVATAADIAALDIDERYVGFLVTTQFNSGSARVAGLEVSAKQSLQFVPFLGTWGRSVTLFANATKLELHGNQNASFSTFQPKSVNGGLTYARNPITLIAKWTYRGEQRLGAQPAFGPDAFQYWGARTQLDLNADYRIGPNLSLFANARNVFNARPSQLIYGAQTPVYARKNVTQEFGVGFSVGVRGSF